MSNGIRIHYEGNKFLVKCPMWANDALQAIATKRWSKANKYWTVPPMRKNVEAIRELMKVAEFTSQEAKDAVVEHESRLKDLAKKSEGFPSWYKFKTQPRDHQRRGLNKMYKIPAGALFMDRGTGKTKVAIDLATALRMEGEISAVLVIVRRSLRLNWVGYDKGDGPGQKEGFVGHCPLDCSFHLPDGADDSAKKKYARWLGEDHDFPVMVMSTEGFSQGGAKTIAMSFIQAHMKVMIIVDESHDFGTFNSIRSVVLHELGLYGTYKLVLTGTPQSTGPMNLYSQFEFLDPNIIGIGDYYAFRNRYAIMGGFPNPKTGKPTKIVGYQNMEELATILAPYVFEVRKDEVLDLPPKVFERRVLQLTKEQRDLYRQIKKERKFEHDGSEIEIKNTLELALRLHQVCGGFISSTEAVNVGDDDNPKIKKVTKWTQIIPAERNPKVLELVDIIDENPDKKFIIWAKYKPEIEMLTNFLREKYPAAGVVEIHGGISDEGREDAKARFQGNAARFLVGNTQTGGTGHTLTAAHVMYYFNNTEMMIDRSQSEDRAHRDGLMHSVLYIDAMMEGTVDMTIMDSIDAKMDLAEYVRQNIRRASDLLGDA